jgi:hypothetical protein
MRFKLPLVVNSGFIFAILITMQSAQGRRGSMSEVPMDSVRSMYNIFLITKKVFKTTLPHL